MSIRSRLAASYGAGVVLTLVIVGLFVWWQMGAALRGALEMTLETRAAAVLTSLENAGQSGLQEADQTAPGVFVVLFSADGSLVDATTDAPRGIRPMMEGPRLWGPALPRADPDSPRWDLRRDRRRPPADRRYPRFPRATPDRCGTVGRGGFLFGGWLLAGRALRPVDRLIDEAAALGPGDLGRRLALPLRMDEVGRLTLTLNGMLDRIADSVERQRLFVAMASHELRTPLAALRAELDIVERDEASLSDYREALHEAQGDAIRLTSLATSLLDLAATREDAHSISRTPVRLRQLALSVVRGVDPLARQRGMAIELEVPDVVVWVDRTRIEHALGNLLKNAVTYGGGRGGEVEVHGRIDGEPGRRTLMMEVLDRGPGLGDDPPDELFAPFHRGTHASGAGSGLGLATVAGAVRAHGGTYGAANRDGGGAQFWFAVPCDQVTTESSRVPLDPGAAAADAGDIVAIASRTDMERLRRESATMTGGGQSLATLFLAGFPFGLSVRA